ncbi:tyrosine-type recombinase/integrase [Streptomyces fructofermentans]|uniref:Site-specific integrase n=1 Tax=Streptomyces fructofermentans TaxID=152141 RepID=A0A918K832_9ACTN|nr:site-specific integrase [Streptomyces fructofermentans]GGX54131.1 site-specific integrase [Streptomyces fructofermentans]
MANIAKRPNGKWRARYRDDAGKEHARHFPRKVDAQRWLDEVSASVLTGQYVDPQAGRVTFRAYGEQWRLAKPHRPTTQVKAEQHLRVHAYPAFGDKPLARIRRSDVQSWVTGLEKSGLRASTVRTTFNTIRAVFRAAVADRVIAVSPCTDVDLPEVPRRRVVPLTVDQVQALAAAMPDRYRALVILGAGTGLRPGELFGLQVRHVDFFKRQLHVEQQVQQTKGGGTRVCPPKTKESERVIPLPDVVLHALVAHLRDFPAGADDFLFQDPKGGAVVSTRLMDSSWRPARKLAGLPSVTMHQLRHTYASLLIAAGESVKVVCERLGHTNAAMTLNVYSHLFPDSEDKTRKAIDGAFSAPLQDHADSERTDDAR